MDKPRRALDPFEEQDADYKRGYAACVDGEPKSAKNGMTAWLDGWEAAKEEQPNRML
jgi:ribosome modulation factor